MRLPYLSRYSKAFYVLTALLSSLACAGSDHGPKPTLELGAEVFNERCVLCHGGQGMGEGALALKIEDYPETNLLTPRKAKTFEEIREAVVYGGTTGKLSKYMPPMGNDITWTEVESVIMFVQLLREENKRARTMLDSEDEAGDSSRKEGQLIFASRCTLCHGKFGEGDGRMAKVIKTPPPADLTTSRLPDQYLVDIISKGGEAVGRSPQMPPWGDQLNKIEIESLMAYLKSIRD